MHKTPYAEYRLTELQINILEDIRGGLCGDIAGFAVEDWLLGYCEFQDLPAALATYRPLGEHEAKVATLFQEALAYFQQANQAERDAAKWIRLQSLLFD